ncbi:hypothetical protein EYF80_027430 [Liparis tanakae]|uniref:Uncharacterized protein n=1 Tax=Liparis tanakae TaxID=230148 RepID=A0A4Z2HBD5_9TELE|nr:hypothetical protein EYF80_027430 [Liparis tanakae]
MQCSHSTLDTGSGMRTCLETSCKRLLNCSNSWKGRGESTVPIKCCRAKDLRAIQVFKRSAKWHSEYWTCAEDSPTSRMTFRVVLVRIDSCRTSDLLPQNSSPTCISLKEEGFTPTHTQLSKAKVDHRGRRSLYCIFWNFVSALPAHSSTYPSTTWNTVLWMAWVKCMWSWSMAAPPPYSKPEVAVSSLRMINDLPVGVSHPQGRTSLKAYTETEQMATSTRRCHHKDTALSVVMSVYLKGIPKSPHALLFPASFHPLPTCSQAGHHQSKLGLVLLLRHVVEGAAKVLFCLGQPVEAHLEPRALSDDLGGVAALRDPDVAVGRVGVSLAFKEHQLSRVDGEHFSCPQALARVHLQVRGSDAARPGVGPSSLDFNVFQREESLNGEEHRLPFDAMMER